VHGSWIEQCQASPIDSFSLHCGRTSLLIKDVCTGYTEHLLPHTSFSSTCWNRR